MCSKCPWIHASINKWLGEKSPVSCAGEFKIIYADTWPQGIIVILSLLECEQHLSSSQRLQYEQGIGVTLQGPHLLDMLWSGDWGQHQQCWVMVSIPILISSAMDSTLPPQEGITPSNRKTWDKSQKRLIVWTTWPFLKTVKAIKNKERLNTNEGITKTFKTWKSTF